MTPNGGASNKPDASPRRASNGGKKKKKAPAAKGSPPKQSKSRIAAKAPGTTNASTLADSLTDDAVAPTVQDSIDKGSASSETESPRTSASVTPELGPSVSNSVDADRQQPPTSPAQQQTGNVAHGNAPDDVHGDDDDDDDDDDAATVTQGDAGSDFDVNSLIENGKSAIKVVVRVRPLSGNERGQGEDDAVYVSEDQQTVGVKSEVADSLSSYTFHKVCVCVWCVQCVCWVHAVCLCV